MSMADRCTAVVQCLGCSLLLTHSLQDQKLRELAFVAIGKLARYVHPWMSSLVST